MLGNLGENLTNTMKKLVGMSVIDKKTIKEVVKDIQRALIQSDVNIQLVLKLSKTIFFMCFILPLPFFLLTLFSDIEVKSTTIHR